jgi:PAS domain S-box-containing protein
MLAGTVPLIAFGLLHQYFEYRHNVDRTGREKLMLARSVAGAVDSELRRHIAAMSVLAESKRLRDGDIEGFRQQAQAVVARHFAGADILLLQRDGRLVMGTGLASDAPLPAREDLDTIREVVATGRPVVSSIFFASALRRHVVSIEVPVFDAQGRIGHVLSLIPATGAFTGMIAGQRPPGDWMITVLDRNGAIVARSPNAGRYFGQEAEPAILTRLLKESEGVFDGTNRDGVAVLAVFTHAPVFGWAVAIDVPRSELIEPAIDNAVVAVGFGGVSLALALLATLMVSARIAAPIGALRTLATAGDADNRAAAMPTGLPETDDVAHALRVAQTRRDQSERRYRALFNANPHPMAVYDLETLRLLEVNEALVRQYGWSREELQAMTLVDVHPPEGRERLLKSVAERQRGYINMPQWRKDGTRFDIEAVVRVIDYDGQHLGLAVLHDITDQNLTRSRLAEAIRAFPGSFRLYDRDERLVLANDKHWMPLDKPFEVVIGGTIEAAVRAAADAEADAAARGRKEEWYRERLAQFRRGQTDAEVMTSDGRWCHLLERRTADGATIVLRLDITARKAIEAQLRQAQKMETMGQLAGGVAHDFNNSLAVIMMSVEEILDLAAKDSEIQASAQTALHATQQASALTRRLLAFSRRQEVAPVEVDVAAVVEDLRGILRSSVSRAIELVVRASGEGWRCVLERTQLETAVMNLVVNARDAIDGRGTITVESGYRHVGESEAAQSTDLRAGDWIFVAVGDDGQGMSAETRARIFEPFFTTKEVGKGTGLGLSQIHSLVTQCDGFITVDSTVGVGTRIAMHFPARPVNDKAAAAV